MTPEEIKRNIENLTAKIEKNPGDKKALSIRATYHFLNGDYISAIADYDLLENAAIKEELTSDFFLVRGKYHELAGNLNDAISDYEKAYEMSPNNCGKDFLEMLSRLLYVAGRPDKALIYAEKDADNIDLLEVCHAARFEMGDVEGALNDISKIKRILKMEKEIG